METGASSAYAATEDPLERVRFVRARGSGRVPCVPGWRWERREPLTDFDLWYVAAGQGTLRLGARDYPVRAGSLFVLRPGELPRATQDERDRVTVIFAHFSMRCPPDRSFLPPRQVQLEEERHELERLLHRLLETAGRDSLWQRTEYDSLLKLIFIHSARHAAQAGVLAGNSRRQLLVQAAIGHIRACGGRVTPAELAAHCGISAQYLSRIFRGVAGESLKRCLVRIKLERAQALLTESSMTASEVAEALGYADLYSFSKLFKKYVGVPPSRYAPDRPSDRRGDEPDAPNESQRMR
ncbi:AraC family transcriptional regulator [Paenibacillus sp. IB182496]|uniref:AraC family transcriptional regulator n=1 Tax=Paenibacillus sabuli TaxID=2772509 RepID=A0A927BQQ2_9BACL|nr:AraC family transcriptional regulator [Paenibacillus sabuli]MBD2843743.1 AraC family transcriptional regulator [Paenibacillus sabuli]